jgi:hypothetical protein
MDHNLGTDLDQLFPDRGQRSVLQLLGQGQGPHEVGEVVGQGMNLQADFIIAEPAA